MTRAASFLLLLAAAVASAPRPARAADKSAEADVEAFARVVVDAADLRLLSR